MFSILLPKHDFTIVYNFLLFYVFYNRKKYFSIKCLYIKSSEEAVDSRGHKLPEEAVQLHTQRKGASDASKFQLNELQHLLAPLFLKGGKTVEQSVCFHGGRPPPAVVGMSQAVESDTGISRNTSSTEGCIVCQWVQVANNLICSYSFCVGVQFFLVISNIIR